MRSFFARPDSRYTALGAFRSPYLADGKEAPPVPDELHATEEDVTERHLFVTFINIAAVCMHIVWAILAVVFSMIIANKNIPTHGMFDGTYRVVQGVTLWRTSVAADAQCGLPPYVPAADEVSALPTQTIYLNRHAFPVGNMDVKYMIVVFFIMSAFFQALQWGIGWKPRCRVLRFVEYSLSAGLMIMAIALQVGIDDLSLLMTLYALIFATNMFGLVAEVLSFLTLYLKDDPPIILGMFKAHYLWIIPHGAGWVTVVIAYATILNSYFTTTACSEAKAPGFVNVIVLVEFALFVSFGVVQLLDRKSTRLNSSH